MRNLTICCAFIALSAGTALAGPTVKYEGKLWGSGGNGGPFEFTPTGFTPAGMGGHGASATRFVSFCIENGEYISQGTTYNVTFNTYAIAGGSGRASPVNGVYSTLFSGTGNDSLDVRTAYLYDSFIKGSLTGVGVGSSNAAAGFAYGNAISGEALQKAFWYLENEIESVALNSLEQELVEYAMNTTWNDIGNVRVMNLTDGNGNLCQSQLVIIPLPGGAGMATVGMAGLLGLGVIRRRR